MLPFETRVDLADPIHAYRVAMLRLQQIRHLYVSTILNNAIQTERTELFRISLHRNYAVLYETAT